MRNIVLWPVLGSLLLFAYAAPCFGETAKECPPASKECEPAPKECGPAQATSTEETQKKFSEYARVLGVLACTPRDSFVNQRINCKDMTQIFENKNLQGLDFSCSTIENCSFNCSTLNSARFNGATLKNCSFDHATAVEVEFHKTNFHGVTAKGAKLTSSEFHDATLADVGFNQATLTGASFKNAKIQGVQLPEADIRYADLAHAELSVPPASSPDASSDPTPIPSGIEFIPAPDNVIGLKGLDSVIVHPNARSGMVNLRKALRNAGCTQEARELTYAMERYQTNALFVWPKTAPEFLLFPLKAAGGVLRLVFFDLFSRYGMDPWRVLEILLAVICVCSLIYVCPIAEICAAKVYCSIPEGSSGATKSIPWLDTFWTKKDKAAGRKKPWWGIVGRSLYFSLLAATTVGWREINIGIWLKRIQREDYDLKPTGWVRVVTGIQALLCTYLLALWSLSYFGAPFD